MEIGAAIFFTDYSITPTEPVQAMSHLALRIICRGGAGWSGPGMTSGGRLRFEKMSSPGAKVIHGCLLRVQMCRVGRSHDVSSAARTHVD